MEKNIEELLPPSPPLVSKSDQASALTEELLLHSPESKEELPSPSPPPPLARYCPLDCFFLPTTEELVAKSDQGSTSTEELLPPLPLPQPPITKVHPAGNLKEGAFDRDVVPSSLLEITPILRVANEIEPSNSRVAYLCRLYALEKAQSLDPTSSGRGVRQFKVSLLQRLERDCDPSLSLREKNSDAREMQSFYRHYTSTYIPSLQNSADKLDSEQITKINQTAGVLCEVLKVLSPDESLQCHEILKLHVGELSVCEEMTATNEEVLNPPPSLVAKSAWDYFFPMGEMLNPLPPLAAKNDQASVSAKEMLPPSPPPLPLPQRTLAQIQPAGNLEEGAFDSDVVPSSLVECVPILHLANEVEPSNSRVAYLCRFYAFEKAHRLDPTSSGRGVRQFKVALLQRLERDYDPSLSAREKNSDALEMQSFYGHYTSTYIQTLQNSADKLHGEQLTKINQSAVVLFEVLKAVHLTESIEVDNEILKFNVGDLSVCDIEEKMTATDEEVLPPPPPLIAENDL